MARTDPARSHRGLAALALVAIAVLVAACGSDDADVAATDQVPGAGGDAGRGSAPARVDVRIEDLEGVFIEGFEVGLRFETGDGELIASVLWTDFVRSTGATDIEAFYDSVLEQDVPPGEVRVSAEANVGMGPPASVPDLDGPLPCEVVLDLAPGQVVTLEVAFDGTNDCVRRVDPTAAPGPEGTDPSPPTSSTGPPDDAGDRSLSVGTEHAVDVDLECQAFELGGYWVLVEGDTSGWQPAGERHEGGTFTIEASGRGRFSGDAAGEKRAIFELLPEGAEPECIPVPRPG